MAELKIVAPKEFEESIKNEYGRDFLLARKEDGAMDGFVNMIFAPKRKNMLV